MRCLLLLMLLLTGCDDIVKRAMYNPECVDGYYVHPSGYENQGNWGLQNLFCEEIELGKSTTPFAAHRCMKVGDDPRIKFEAVFSNVLWAPTKCFNTMAGVRK